MYLVEVTCKNYVTGKTSVTRMSRRFKTLQKAEAAAARMNALVKPDGQTATCEMWGRVVRRE